MSYKLPLLALAFTFILIPSFAQAATYTVNCPTGGPGAYPSINSVLPLLLPGDVVLVSGTCTEDVYLGAQNQISLVGPANLAGNLTIADSLLIYVYGMNVTSTNNDGIDVSGSRDVTLDTCVSNGNSGQGTNSPWCKSGYVRKNL